MTPAERKALLFLAGVGLLGTGARLVAARTAGAPTAAERSALAAQLADVDSARDVRRAHGRARATADDAGQGGRRRRRRASDRRCDGSGAECDGAASRAPRARADIPPREPAGPVGPVDLDVADAVALEALPGIGPALARRIVADRDANGAFGSLGGLQRVRGIGPRLAERLAPTVTFSGTARLPSAAEQRRARSRARGADPPAPD